jgi:uncharacterized protein with ParB-like and HNH nuclease domain
MRPDKLSLFEIFGRDRRYLVPLFQRQYVWTRDEQWDPLWDDIRGKALAVIERASRRPHFLGAMVLSQLPVYGRQVAADEIIDGQQRLTTMQLLLAAFRDIARSRSEATYERDLKLPLVTSSCAVTVAARNASPQLSLVASFHGTMVCTGREKR